MVVSEGQAWALWRWAGSLRPWPCRRHRLCNAATYRITSRISSFERWWSTQTGHNWHPRGSRT